MWAKAAPSLGTPGSPEAGKSKEGFSLRLSEVTRLADTLIADFWAPELGENRQLLF